MAAGLLVMIVGSPILAIWVMLATFSDPIYSSVVLVRLPSPTGAWTAIVREDIVDDGPLSDITAGVDLISKEHPEETNASCVLGVDTGGDRGEDPRIAWSARNELSVTVPNISYLKICTTNIDGVTVDLHYDPDDPVARAKWQRQLEKEDEGYQ
jgi:hypothetical protein